MSTRAIQIEFLLSGVVDPTTYVPLTEGTVYFYAAGTSTAKNVWTEKEKTNAYTSFELSAGGLKQLYGDGIYKVVVKDVDDAIVYTWDDIKIRAHNFSVVSKTANYTATLDDDVILVNNTSGHVTITLPPAATMEYPISIIHTAGTNNIIIDPNSTELIDGASTYTFSSIYSTVTCISNGSAIYKTVNVALSLIFGATITLANTGLHILDTNATHDLIIKPGSNLTADKTLTLTTGDADRIITLSGNPTLADWFDQAVKVASSPTFDVPTLTGITPIFLGYVQRPRFTWKDVDEIYISAGAYHHKGTKDQIVYWSSQLTSDIGSPGANDWYYLYLDDSAIVTADTNLLTASEFVWSNTEPTWTEASHAWMNGDDRCIFAVFTTGSSYIEEFGHSSSFVTRAYSDDDITVQDVDSTWVDAEAALTIPKFAIMAQVSARTNTIDAGTGELRWRTNGHADTTGKLLMRWEDAIDDVGFGISNVITDDNQLIELYCTKNATDTFTISTSGWYFPQGM